MMLTDESDDANSHRYTSDDANSTFFMTWRVRIWNSFPLIKYIYDYLAIIEIHGYIVKHSPPFERMDEVYTHNNNMFK